MDKSSKPLQLDLRGILHRRVPESKMRWIPESALVWLEKLIHQDELNAILRYAFPAEGSEFSAKALEYLDIKVQVEGTEKLPLKRSVFASNHPLGGLDGIALIQLLGQHYGDENISFLVNDMLTNVIPLSRVFLPVNKYGGQARGATKLVNEAYESDKQIVVFPAGLVSRKNGKKIRDLEWKKTFISKALATDRDIVPVRFMGENSRLFYSTALWRKRLGLKVNIEQALLPGELCGARGKTFKIIIGDPIPADKLRATGKSAPELAETIRRIVYSIGG